MKKLSFSMLAMAGLLLASCADKDVIAEGGGSQGETLSDGYMALNINLPTTPSTRAVNDDYDDGTPNEYRVNDCALLLFEGTSESTAKLISVQKVDLPFVGNTDDVDNDNITTTHKAVATVSGYSGPGANNSNHLYALAFLNYQNILEIPENGGSAKIGGSELTEGGTSATTFSQIQQMTTNVDLLSNGDGLHERYFFMTNAILSTKRGGVQDPTANGVAIFQLATLDGKVYPTRQEAIDNPSGNILVERAVAKATLSYSSTAASDMTKSGGVFSVEIDNVEWLIDNTEPSTYILRNPGETTYYGAYLGYNSDYFSKTSSVANNYRFVGSVSVATSYSYNTPGDGSGVETGHNHDLSEAYRTYWCVDPQYDETATLTHPTTRTYIPANGAPLYCYENTFNVENQLYKNTTRAILKVTVKAYGKNEQGQKGAEIEEPLYSINNDGCLYTESDVKSHMIQQIFKNLRFREMVEENLKENVERDGQGNYTLTEEVFNKYFTITITKSTDPQKGKENIWELTNITYKNTATGDANTSPFKDNVTFNFTPVMEDIKTLVNDNVVARKYEGGVMYYEARFKHFAGDEPTVNGTTKTPALNDLAPWNCWETTAGVKAPSSEKSYPNYDNDSESAERNYLGRYGMVRNNWYDVKVDKFLKPGLPVEPSTTFADGDGDTPDDHIDDYISVRIHVLSWAKRTQSWQF